MKEACRIHALLTTFPAQAVNIVPNTRTATLKLVLKLGLSGALKRYVLDTLRVRGLRNDRRRYV